MDLFYYYEPYRLWICKPCGYGLPPSHADTHIRKNHGNSLLAKSERRKVINQLRQRPWLDPKKDKCPEHPPESPPIPHLILSDGIRCGRCKYICIKPSSMDEHWRWTHKTQKKQKPIPVKCQRMFRIQHGSHYFVVTPTETARTNPIDQGQAACDQVNRELNHARASFREIKSSIPACVRDTQLPPWLEKTQWLDYLKGQDLAQVAWLGAKPRPDEPLLEIITKSVGRLVDQGVRAIQDHRISQFDELLINAYTSFVPQKYERPINVGLTKPTWRNYTSFWQRLLCFTYRTTFNMPQRLSYCLTQQQDIALQQLDNFVSRLHDALDQRPQSPDLINSLYNQVDLATLTLSVAFLDHDLGGGIYESPLVSFSAVLGIDTSLQSFRSPKAYTTYISGLIKISQIMVIRQAVRVVDEGHLRIPSPIIDYYRTRCFLYGMRTPFSWLLRLRVFGKRIRNQNTRAGDIIWSGDLQTLTFHKLQFTMDGFRCFLHTQIRLAQDQLCSLLFRTSNGQDSIPSLEMRELRDEHSNYECDWSFLRDNRNRRVLQTDSGGDQPGDRWLMNRVTRTEPLRNQFLWPNQVFSNDLLYWRNNNVARYLQQVNAFLERLLLLIHITGGQPPRGTEIIATRHRNSHYGESRNIFIEHGLICIVTTSSKGSSSQANTKLIHRYLPKVVSEMVIYYLWLVLPFRQQLENRAGFYRGLPSPFLWAKAPTDPSEHQGPLTYRSWPSEDLTTILQREGRVHLQTELSTLSYRHAAIAISRAHLRCGGFQRDYGVDNNIWDLQAGHTTWTAETIYARERRVAPGHVETRQRGYRVVSEQWHKFLRIDQLEKLAKVAGKTLKIKTQKKKQHQKKAGEQLTER